MHRCFNFAATAVLSILGVGGLALAQGQDRAPRETVTALLNGKKVTVEYGRPALKGRTIDALLEKLPADRIWRAGVDQATTLTTETDVMIGNKRVPKGHYTLYVHAPASGDWSLLVNSDPGVPLKKIYAAAPPEMADALWPRLDGYAKVADKEVARIALEAKTPAEPMERFLIGLTPARDGVSAITLTWDGKAWTTAVKAAP